MICDAMIDAGHRLLIAAPTIAEILRKQGQPMPRYKGIEIVAFDLKAAELWGERMPFANLIEAPAKGGLGKDYWKYDAMIMACVIRGKAAVFVTLDADCHKLAQGAKIRVAHPNERMPSQTLPNGDKFIS